MPYQKGDPRAKEAGRKGGSNTDHVRRFRKDPQAASEAAKKMWELRKKKQSEALLRTSTER